MTPPPRPTAWRSSSSFPINGETAMTPTTRILLLAAAALLAACAKYNTRLSTPTGAIVGALRDTSGAPLDQASIHLRLRGERTDLRCALTDSTGRFAFTDLAPGDYDVFLVE